MQRQEQEIENTKIFTTTIEEDDEYLYKNFINALKSKTTKEDYTRRLKYFLEFLGFKDGQYSKMIDSNKDKKMIEADIKSFLVYLRETKKLSYRSALQYFNSLKKFYYVNSEYDLKWQLIRMYLGDDDDESELEDRPYTRQEIQTMLKTATDIRVKIIILLMSSSGVRYGAISFLTLKNLQKIDKYDLYIITVYQKSRKYNYKTFCTPECASMIDSYLNYRKHSGEILKAESPLLREQFNAEDRFKVNNPKPISKSLVRYLVNEVLTKHSALRHKLAYNHENKRKIGKNSTMQTHGMRKYFDTESRKAGVYPDIVEILMGHKLPGVRKHYFKPDIQTLLEGTAECKGYVTSIDALTINDENRLKMENLELKKQDDYQKYTIDKRMKEKDEQIQFLTSRLGKFEESVTGKVMMTENQYKKLKVEREEISDLRELLVSMAKDSNFPIEEFNKKFGTDFK